MQPIVGRFFAQLEPKPNDSEGGPQPLSYYYSHPAIVVLGDPGSGKTTCFSQSATTEVNAVCVSIRDFLTLQAYRWEGKTLYLDGLDEQRTKSEDGRGILDLIRRKLDQLKLPHFRLSCRAADWYGESEAERLRVVSPNGKVLVLRLEPLSDSDIINIAGDKLPNPADFLVQAKRRGIDPLLRNPQTLQLILAEVQDGVWPATRADLFQKACIRLLQETNPEHTQAQAGYVPMDRLLTAAGYLSVVHICGGTKGHALNSQDADEAFPYIGELYGDQEDLFSAVRRRAFRGDGPGRVTPIHRTVAEYLSGYFLACRLRAGLPLKRILSLLTGYDGGILAELRGIYAWLACLCEEEAATLIRRDPLGLVLYGDASKLSTCGKRMLIDDLRDLAIENPGFRVENWSAEPFGALASPDMVPVFKKILCNQNEPSLLLGCILDAIEHGHPLPELSNDLIQLVRDNARLQGTRVAALDAYLHIYPNDMETVRMLLDDIHEGRVHDEHRWLRGKLLYTLYPKTVGPHEIGRYLVQAAEDHINEYTMFVTRELVHRTSPEVLPLLFTAIDTTGLVGRPHHLVWSYFWGRLILKMLHHLGESASASQLYEWLGLALDQHSTPIADREEAAAIQTWLRSHPAVVQGLFSHWFSVTPFDKPRIEVMYFWKRLYGISPPYGFHRWLFALAELELDPARSEFLFREAVQGSTSLLRDDGPTLEELHEFTARNPRFKDALQSELCWNIDHWRKEDAEERRKRKQKDEAQREIRIQQLSEHLEKIRAGAPTQPLVNLAKAYFGLFYGLDHDALPVDRLSSFTTPEIAEAALQGFVAALQCPDVPSPKMIGELGTEGKEYIIGFPILAGLDVLASKSLADALLLPPTTLQSALAFHYAIITERERDWVNFLIGSRPDLAAASVMAYWRPQLACKSKHIRGLFDLIHEEVMKPIAQRVSLPLLKDYPNTQEDSLELLLHAAICNGDRTELLSYAHYVLTHTSLTDENRALWFAVAFALDYNSVKGGLAQYIQCKGERAVWVLGFLCPSRGVQSDTSYPLPVEALASLIAMTGHSFSPRHISGVGWHAIRSPEGAADSVRLLIRRLGTELSHEATLALGELRQNPDLAAWHDEIAYVQADQARQRRELAFKYPTTPEVIETLNHGRPANAADLQALVKSHLDALSAELRDGPTGMERYVERRQLRQTN